VIIIRMAKTQRLGAWCDKDAGGGDTGGRAKILRKRSPGD